MRGADRRRRTARAMKHEIVGEASRFVSVRSALCSCTPEGAKKLSPAWPCASNQASKAHEDLDVMGRQLVAPAAKLSAL